MPVTANHRKNGPGGLPFLYLARLFRYIDAAADNRPVTNIRYR